jgi:hypothetical protein
MTRARPEILLLLAGAFGCAAEEVHSDGATAAPVATSTASATSEQDESPVASAPAEGEESFPMPGPGRGRLGAAVALNAACVSCHPSEAEEWARSRHRQSDTNAAYRAAFAIEPLPFCRGCHAPEANPRKPPPREVSKLGVGCVSCHVTEEGFVLAAASSGGKAPHPLRRSVDFARARGCAGCHEFRFPGVTGDDDGELMQTTAREHQRSPGRGRACADCHMPLVSGRRSHAFEEIRDPVWLRKNLQVNASLHDGNGVRVTLTQPDPGHAFPTGDLHRRLEVGCEILDENGTVVQREVRHLARHFVLPPGQPRRVLLRDDRVFYEPKVVDMTLSPAPPGGGPTTVHWWVSLQRVANVGMGENPADATIESAVPLHAGVLPWQHGKTSDHEP